MTTTPQWTFADVGEGGLLIGRAPATGDYAGRLRELARRLLADHLPGVYDYVPASTTLLLCYDSLTISRAALVEQVCRYEDVVPPVVATSRTISITVEYGGRAGPDLEEVAAATGLTLAEVVRLHTAAPFPVEMIGFMPGFPYLGGLPVVLNLPRRSVPRVMVPAGSVAIANGRSGIYPAAAPGGWHLIGRTTVLLFDPEREPPALLAPGDYVQFVAQATHF
ncbi:MAG: 5-oxoprolinase subunit PxpB [Herpetosiphonaceae bacterium]|nr:5-oxoprolinase subunit PxpB [Herpetosiphonaceae bacterium]